MAMAFVSATHLTLGNRIKCDKASFLETMCARAKTAADANDQRTLFKFIKSFGTFEKRALPAVTLEDGTLATEGNQARHRWLRYFARQQCGQVGQLGEVW